jgi:hypothetical protein
MHSEGRLQSKRLRRTSFFLPRDDGTVLTVRTVLLPPEKQSRGFCLVRLVALMAYVLLLLGEGFNQEPEKQKGG